MKTTIAGLIALLALAGVGRAETTKATVVKAADLKFEKSPTNNVEIAVVYGDPMKGAYGMIVKFPAGYSHGEHKHTNDIKYVVIQGSWHDSGAGTDQTMGPGSYAFVPGKTQHSNSCEASGPCVVYQEGIAKFDTLDASEAKPAAPARK
jgi:quercetin dioxygenase-like cupin family protein